jgi:parallel beta-helix repeat protein
MGGKSIKRKGLVVGIILLFVGTGIIPSTAQNIGKPSLSTSSGNRLYVGGSGPGNYTRIQNAINAAVDGDTIFVFDDSSPYDEHLIINKEIAITGENKDTTKIFGTGENKDILFIQSKNVTICNFTIQYGSDSHSGIFIRDSSYVTIKYCMFSDIPSMDAVTIDSSESVTIINCIMSDSFDNNTINFKKNSRYISGITLEKDCSNTTISGNTISNASYAGIIVLKGCSNTRVTGNYIHSNDLFGIVVQYSNSTYILENKVLENHNVGISIFESEHTRISGNSFENNGYAGVGIVDSVNTSIERNNFIRNGGVFTFTLRKGYENRFRNNFWEENFWGRSRLLPKPLFGAFIYQRDVQFPMIIIPWLIFDWHPVQKPYDIPEMI